MNSIFGIPNHCIQFQAKRLISLSQCCYAKPKKKISQRTKLADDERGSERTVIQAFSGQGRKFIPYDKNQEITAKSTGPRREGGSKYAAELTAKHVVPITGYINPHGRFMHVKEMRPNFVVPDLKDCTLKPYVSYRTAEINQSKFTAAELYQEQALDELQEDMAKIEKGEPLEEVIQERMKKMDEEERLKQTENADESQSDKDSTLLNS